MKLYLVQHALAVSKEDDPERGLSEQGMADARKMAEFLARMSEPGPARIVHSGKKRARQTAELLAERLNIQQVREMLDLDPMADPGVWAAHASAMADDIMLVGHLPHVSRLASLLLVGHANVEVVRFANAGVVCLAKNETGWSLRWMVTPDLV
ncbi:MAG: phosphohistidine phosphatase SixA [Mariprofundaceae bacterium]